MRWSKRDRIRGTLPCDERVALFRCGAFPFDAGTLWALVDTNVEPHGPPTISDAFIARPPTGEEQNSQETDRNPEA